MSVFKEVYYTKMSQVHSFGRATTRQVRLTTMLRHSHDCWGSGGCCSIFSIGNALQGMGNSTYISVSQCKKQWNNEVAVPMIINKKVQMHVVCVSDALCNM